MRPKNYEFLEIKYEGQTLPIPINIRNVKIEDNNINISVQEIIDSMLDIITDDFKFPYTAQYISYIESKIGELRRVLRARAYTFVKDNDYMKAHNYLKLIENLYGTLDTEEEKFIMMVDIEKELSTHNNRKKVINMLENLQEEQVDEETACKLARLYHSEGQALKAYLYLNDRKNKMEEREEINQLIEEYENSACVEAYDTYMNVGRYAEAITWISRAIKINGFPDYYYKRSLAQYNLGNYENALNDAKNAVLNDNTYKYHIYLSNIYIEMGNNLAAKEILDEIRTKEIDNMTKMTMIYNYVRIGLDTEAKNELKNMERAELKDEEIKLYEALKNDFKNSLKKPKK